MRFRFAGREILKNKLKKIEKMNYEELEDLHRFMRDDFMSKYLPSKKPSPKKLKYDPVVIETKKR